MHNKGTGVTEAEHVRPTKKLCGVAKFGQLFVAKFRQIFQIRGVLGPLRAVGVNFFASFRCESLVCSSTVPLLPIYLYITI